MKFARGDAASPNWHFVTAMRPECPLAVYDLIKCIAWKYSVIVFGK
jgi:hypothetical protein